MAPVDALAPDVPAEFVWHCIARAAPEDKTLSDDQWAQIACRIMHQAGLAPYGQHDDAVRWVAVRHAEDHIHLVATLARQDMQRVNLSNSRYRLQAARHDIEVQYGLRRIGPGDRSAARRPTRAETEKTFRLGGTETPRTALRKKVASAAGKSSDEAGFFSALAEDGVQVRLRRSSTDPSQIVGYAVTLPDAITKNGQPIWFSGGRLAADLTLPKLRHRWTDPAVPTAANPASPLDLAVTVAGESAEQLRQLTHNPSIGSDAAWATADLLRSMATTLNQPELTDAADRYDRAAREPYGRLPSRSRIGILLRHTARLVSHTGDRDLVTTLRLIGSLIQLIEAIAELRTAQLRMAQADAAHSAASALRPLLPDDNHATSSKPGVRTAAQLAQHEFPQQIQGRQRPTAAPTPQRHASAAPRPRLGPPRVRWRLDQEGRSSHGKEVPLPCGAAPARGGDGC